MNGRFLLDTNIVIALFANETAVVEQLQNADEVFVPAIVLGELYFGALKSRRSQANTERVSDFDAQSSVLACDSGVAMAYGLIKSRLATKGRPIPENDLWIAAIATHHGLTLVSRDLHFGEIGSLSVQSW